MTNKSATLIWAYLNRVVNIALLIYAVAACAHAYTHLYWDYEASGIGQFVSIWIAIILCIFYATCLACDSIYPLRVSLEKSTIRALLFYGLAFPLSCYTLLVCVLDLIFSQRSSVILMRDFNRSLDTDVKVILHGLPLLGVLLEGALYYHAPVRPARGLALLALFFLVHHAILVASGLTISNWLYPFIEWQDPALKVIYLLGMAVVGMSFYFVGDAFVSLIYRRRRRSISIESDVPGVSTELEVEQVRARPANSSTADQY